MSNRIFKWRAINESTGTVRLRVLGVQFGDGYRQIVGDGINTRTESWPVSFVGSKADIDELEAFLEDHIGQSFLWTNPLGRQIRVTCEEYQPSRVGGDLYTVSTTFNQFFKP